MTIPLNKVGTDDVLWESTNYEIRVCADRTGYQILNVGTGAVEAYVDQEPAAVLTLLFLQENYDEVMEDPQGEFRRRKAQRSMPAQKMGMIVN